MVKGELERIPASVLLESISSLLLLFDAAGELALSNVAARNAFGLGAEGKGGENLAATLAPVVAAVLSTRAPVRIEQTRVPVDGESRTFGLSASPVRVGDGVSAVLVTGRDITDHENLKREIRDLERAAQVETVVRKVSHELRNPLNAIRGYAQFLSLTLESSDPGRSSVEVIVKEVDRMDRILTGLRELGAASHLELTVADPECCLRDAVQTVSPLLRAKGVATEVRVAGPLPGVLHDPGRLHQVFLNLLKNAAEAVDFGGRVAVSAGALGDSGFWAEVVDDGPGVDEALGDRIFELFVTTKGGQGEGIGLAVSQEIVGQHGGSLTWARGPEGGAAFWVEIPGR